MRFGMVGLVATLALMVSVAQAADNVVTEEEQAEGFVSLFDGKTLTGWEGSTDGYAVQDGAIVCMPGKGGLLVTDKDHADFVFRFEFRLEEGCNNGIALRSSAAGNPAYSGMECQILDDVGFRKANDGKYDLQPWQVHASIYGVIPGKPNVVKVGEWNTEEIVLCGRYVRVTVNGQKVIEAKLPTSDQPTMDSPNEGGHHPGLDNTTGRIGFCGHNDKVEFRNLRVRDL